MIDGATALLGVEEPADMAEVLVLLAPHGVFAPVRLLGERAPRLLEAHAMMARQPLDVPFVERDQRVRATIPGALATVVHVVRPAPISASWRPLRPEALAWLNVLRCSIFRAAPLARQCFLRGPPRSKLPHRSGRGSRPNS